MLLSQSTSTMNTVTLRSLLIVVLAISAYGIPTKAPTPMIVGGQDAADGKYPYAVYVKLSGVYVCTGAIIAKRTILTGAQCTAIMIDSVKSSVTIHAGTNLLSDNGQVYQVDKAISHDGFSLLGLRNDVGVIHVTKDIEYNDKVQSIAFAPVDAPTYEGKKGSVASWGATRLNELGSDRLQEATVEVISTDTCKKTFWFVREDHICAFSDSVGLCSLDGGGPLVVDNVVVGVMSFGKPCTTGEPHGYTRVSTYSKWIEDNKSGSQMPIISAALLLLPLLNSLL